MRSEGMQRRALEAMGFALARVVLAMLQEEEQGSF